MTVASIEQQLKQKHIQVRKRLWPVQRKPSQLAHQPAPIMIDTKEANRIRDAALAEQRLAEYRANQRRAEERERLAKEEKRKQQKLNAEARRQAKKERAELRANVGPSWEDISPTLRDGTMEEIRDQVMDFFPQYSFEDVITVNRDPRRGHVLRMIIVAINHLKPVVDRSIVGAFVNRDHSTTTWHLRHSHLAGTIGKRRFLEKELDGKIDFIREMIEAGHTWNYVADRLGISRGSVGKVLKRHGLTA